MRMLPTTLGRNGGFGSFNDLQKGLLDALTRDIPGDRSVLTFASDLVNLINVDDAAFGLLNVAIRGLNELEKDILNILTHISCLCQRGRIDNAEGNIK